ncbi:hypothetical protein BV20DRAFT_959413 [Pilatotrama ljubarskyi]|nr:hypothetical protein BV20DRAFT_959413 [Pilatotrama ljubarskyi]
MTIGGQAAKPLAATEHDDVVALGVPDRLRNHPELRRRGVLLTQILKPTIVYRTHAPEGAPEFVAKIVKPESDEAQIYRLLQSDSNPRNHTIPCEIIECAEQQPILLMPFLTSLDGAGMPDWLLSRMLSTFLQVVEAIVYLHDRNIVHLDICNGNILIATEAEARADARLAAGRVYLVDFETSRQLDAGPGVQHSIPIPPAQIKPPAGMDRFDPYSWDVYCLGKLFERMAKSVYWKRRAFPWAVSRIAQWIVGNEQGCADICHCRPTARQTRRVIVVFLWATRATEFVTALAERALRLFKGSR